MAIKKSKAIYVTDRGEEFYVEDMENSHLANTITHIEKKIEALKSVVLKNILTGEEQDQMRGHIACLANDQFALAKELCRRESCKDEC